MFSFLADLISADSKEDQRKRRERGERRYYTDQQRALGNKAPASNPVTQGRNLLVGALRGVARVPETVARSQAESMFEGPKGEMKNITAKLEANATEAQKKDPDWKKLLEELKKKSDIKFDSQEVKDPIRKLAYGDEKIETYQTRRKGIEKTIGESRFKGAAAPLSFLAMGATIATDPVLPGGKNLVKEVGEEGIKKLVKETSEQGVKQILKKSGIEISDDVAKTIAGNTRASTISKLINKNGTKIGAKNVAGPITVTAHAPTKSKELAGDVARGRLRPDGEYAPIHSLKLGADTKASSLKRATVDKYKTDIQNGKTIDPIVIDNKGYVVDGKHRLAAMNELGVKEVPVVEQIPRQSTKPLTVKKPKAQPGIVDEYAATLKNIDDGAKGGQKIPDGQGGYIRTTEHSPFYSKYYKQYKRPPSKAAYREEAERQLKAGRADPEAQKIFDDSLNPETQSLLGTAEKATSPTTKGDTMPVQDRGPMQFLGGEEIQGTGPTREYGVSTTLKASDNTSPELKQVLTDKDQTYKQVTNEQSLSKAQQAIDVDEDAVMTRLTSPDTALGSDDTAAGLLLMRKFAKEGKHDKELLVAESLRNKLNKAGQSTQAMAMWDKLSPEGIVLSTVKKTEKIKKTKFAKKAAKETEKTAEIKGAVEAGTAPTKNDIDKALKDITNKPEPASSQYTQKLKEATGNTDEMTTGQKLAKRVDNKVKPKPKRQVDELVNELDKKVTQDVMDPVTKKPAKSAIEHLKEVFGRSDEARQAYPEAQQILRTKYADNPKMLEALDNFFESKLDMPAAKSTVDAAIKEQLKKNGVKLSEIIYRSVEEQKFRAEDIAKSLVKEGFDEKSAKQLAEEVVTRVTGRMKEMKQKRLTSMYLKAPARAKKTYADKIAKLSNLGALDDADYINLARAELKLPDLTPEVAGEIHRLVQKAQGMPEGHAKSQIMRDVQRLASQTIPLTSKDKISMVLGIPRAIMASGDLSFGGRQGLVYLTTHPIKFAEAWPKQLKMWKEGFMDAGPRAFDDLMADIKTNPYYKYLQDTDLGIVDVDGLSAMARDEQFIGSELAEKLPGMGRIVRGSNYAYAGMGNTLRANEFYSQIDSLIKSGVKPGTDEFKQLSKDIAKVINNATGRGDIAGAAKHMESLSTVLFSPRLMMSRIQTFNPLYYTKLSGPAKKEALRNLAGLTAFTLGVLGIAKLAGLDVGTDPASADFGKVRVGDTRIDVTGGHAAYLRFGYQVVTGDVKSSITGKESKLGEGITRTRLEAIYSFMENKANPVVSFGTTMVKGKDVSGKSVWTPKGMASQVLERAFPLVSQDFAKMIKNEQGLGRKAGGLGTVLGTGLAVSGFGVQTYGEQDLPVTEKQQQELDLLKKQGKSKEEIESTKNFYQRIKVASAQKDNVSEKINLAIADKDYEEARKLAADYDKKLVEAMREWAKKNPGINKNKRLVKVYNSRKFRLNDTKIKARYRAIINDPEYQLGRK